MGLFVRDLVLTLAPETYTLMRTEADDRERKYLAALETQKGNDDG
jgi:hypothetical protein